MAANLAHDFGPEVRINCVGPGATRTAALESVLTPEIEKKHAGTYTDQTLGNG